MKSLQKSLGVATILLILLISSVKLRAQSPSNLAALECKTATPGIENPLKITRNPDYSIKVGKTFLPEIAYLYNKYLADFGDVLDSVEEPAHIFCKVAPEVSQLNFAVGLDSENKVTDKEDIILFEVYLDEKLTDQRYIRQGTTQNVSINIKANQSLSLKASCLRPEWWNNCPRLSFVETILSK